MEIRDLFFPEALSALSELIAEHDAVPRTPGGTPHQETYRESPFFRMIHNLYENS